MNEERKHKIEELSKEIDRLYLERGKLYEAENEDLRKIVETSNILQRYKWAMNLDVWSGRLSISLCCDTPPKDIPELSNLVHPNKRQYINFDDFEVAMDSDYLFIEVPDGNLSATLNVIEEQDLMVDDSKKDSYSGLFEDLHLLFRMEGGYRVE